MGPISGLSCARPRPQASSHRPSPRTRSCVRRTPRRAARRGCQTATTCRGVTAHQRRRGRVQRKKTTMHGPHARAPVTAGTLLNLTAGTEGGRVCNETRGAAETAASTAGACWQPPRRDAAGSPRPRGALTGRASMACVDRRSMSQQRQHSWLSGARARDRDRYGYHGGGTRLRIFRQHQSRMQTTTGPSF